MTDQGEVLVTGGSGYIGSWCIARLLNDGWRVRTTIRNLAREAEVRRALATVAPAQDRLSFFAADLIRDEGWADAARGCRYLLHVASPLGVENPRDPDVLVRPARDGAVHRDQRRHHGRDRARGDHLLGGGDAGEDTQWANR